ncbi:class I SAM-dependent methyltransferase [Granulicoccus sp. GXG6511]|uniref:class I SAM-dependent methyltransferase n=1 Tax=Granulicoccus sp. GXG6511 TaxID=3381351 RepID=UPI003D7D6718
MNTPPSQWAQIIAADPQHSHRYAERFRALEARGQDIYGEARLLDSMVDRGAHVLDAGCGAGRTGGYLARQGHRVVGVDLDPVLIEAAAADFPGPTWLVGDLAELDLPSRGVADPFDAIISAGNVMTFLHPATRLAVLRNFAAHLAPEGRAVIGFGAERGYSFDAYAADVARAGLRIDARFATWDLRPFTGTSDFLVSILSRA